MTPEKLNTFKGTSKEMKCHGGFQYELGKTVTDTSAIRCGNHGFHSCEAPLDVLRYFPLCEGNRYFSAEAGGEVSRDECGDSKIATSELTLKAEIGLPGLIKAHFEYTHRKAEAGGTNGARSNLAGGARSNLAGGDWSNLAGGDWSNLAGGARSMIVGRNGCKAKAGKNSVIVLTEWGWRDGEWVPVHVKAVIVDGQSVKADTWYTLKSGELTETEGPDNDP